MTPLARSRYACIHKRRQRGFIIDPYRFAAAATGLNPTASNVVFQLHGDELPWIDAGYTPHGIANYSAIVDTTTKPSFCTGSLKIEAADRGARVAVGASDNSFKFGTGAWFMEAQVYWTASGVRIFDTRPAPGSNGWTFTVDSSGNLLFFLDGATKAITTDTPVSSSTWKHVAASYDGTSIRLFVDGALKVTTAVALNVTTGQPHMAVGNSNDMLNGYVNNRLAEMRIVKGESVVTAAFTAPTAKMSDAGTGTLAEQTNVTYSNVVIRSTYDSTVADQSTYARTMTAAGNAVISSAQSKFGGASLLLDGTGDYVSTPDAAEFDLGTGDFQFQIWARRNGTHTSPVLLSCYTGAADGYSTSLNSGSSYVNYWNSTGDGIDVTGVTAIADVTWVHCATGKKDGVLYLFTDGVLQRFVTDTQTTNCAGTMFIGRLNNSITTKDWLGNLDDLQLVKGECQLFQSFAVPTAALPVS